MSRMGYGYGSECHLLRWMGRHRQKFDLYVAATVGQSENPINWLDFGFDSQATWPDAELKGIEFIGDNQHVKEKWKEFWPQRGTPPSWDAVGWIGSGESKELLLVEAKAHIGELKSPCKAQNSGLEQIQKSLSAVKSDLGIADEVNWLGDDYQYANRVAMLWFFRKHGVKARLLLIYFCGDWKRSGIHSPATAEDWNGPLTQQKQRLGLPDEHALSKWIHVLFLPIVEMQ